MPIVLLSSRSESDTTDVLYHHNSDISIASIHSYLLHKAAMNHFFTLILKKRWQGKSPPDGGPKTSRSVQNIYSYTIKTLYNNLLREVFSEVSLVMKDILF